MVSHNLDPIKQSIVRILFLEKSGCRCKKFPDQNFTDFTKALKLLSEEGPYVNFPANLDALLVYVESGAVTGRPDQVCPLRLIRYNRLSSSRRLVC